MKKFARAVVNMRSDTKTIISAMYILADDIQSDDGVANAAIREAAMRLEELLISHNRYEAMRICTPHKFKDMWNETMTGARFDDIVDKLIE